jgi:hypothetical protein
MWICLKFYHLSFFIKLVWDMHLKSLLVHMLLWYDKVVRRFNYASIKFSHGCNHPIMYTSNYNECLGLCIYIFKKKLQMKFLLHSFIFNVLVYVFKFFEINLMNEKYPKSLWKHCNQWFWIVKGLVNGLDFFLKMTYFKQIFNVNHNIIMWWNFFKVL